MKTNPVLALCVFLVFLGCSDPKAVFQDELQQHAKTIQEEMVKIREAATDLAAEINNVYLAVGPEELESIILDATQGGPFELFETGMFYYKPDRTGASYYLAPWNPSQPLLTSTLKKLTLLEDPMKEAFQKSSYVYRVFYGVHLPQSIGMFYPWTDMISLFPPGLDIRVFEWYQRGLGAQGTAAWSAAPFKDLTNRWQLDIASGTQDSGVPNGAVVLTLPLENLVRGFLSTREEAFFLASFDTLVAGQSPTARKILGLAEPDLLTPTQRSAENIEAGETLLLLHEDQPEWAKDLGRRIQKGESGFLLNVKGKDLIFFTAPIPEIRVYLVGALEA